MESTGCKSICFFINRDGEWTDVMEQTDIGRKEVEDMHIYPSLKS
jgi:hypothetical protein